MTLALHAKTSKAAFAGASLLFTILSVGLSFRVFLADRDSQSDTPNSWARAVRLVPENAAYHDQLGRFELLARGDVAASIRELQAAVRLNPFVANYWFDLARSEQVAGNTAEQQRALEQAILAEPTTPEVAWEAGNFFLARGETEKALREFRRVLESDAIMTPATLEMAWRIEPDAAKLLAEAIPPKSDVYLDFLRLLVSRKETDASLKVWAKLADMRQPVDAKRAAAYVDYLLLEQRPDEALLVWQQLAPLCGLIPYLPTQNLIVNPQFELDVLNQGLDWRHVFNYNVRLVIDASEFQDGPCYALRACAVRGPLSHPTL